MTGCFASLRMPENPSFLIAGHVCVDLTPALGCEWPQPGSLIEAGDLHFSMGGAVANVGTALARLGYPVRLAGLVGNDRLGAIAMQLLQPLGIQRGIRIAPGQSTSYSVVIAPRTGDRAFLHCTGANVVFTSRDVREEDIDGAAWLHCGYPPILPAMAAEGGTELVRLFSRAQQKGLRTSLDFCSIAGDAASVDWERVLGNCARFVTVFAPSIDELRVALRQPARKAGAIDDVRMLGRKLVEIGFPIVLIKLGLRGIYLATTSDQQSLEGWKFGTEWRGRELWVPCFRARLVNATGAGDSTIAGFVASTASGAGPERAITIAAACGACSVEAPDAASGIPAMSELDARISAGWQRLDSGAPGVGWIYDPNATVCHFRGPDEKK
jgi:sugar/nucleoside kinase (ribokinase family)